jgi:hypothetical protein
MHYIFVASINVKSPRSSSKSITKSLAILSGSFSCEDLTLKSTRIPDCVIWIQLNFAWRLNVMYVFVGFIVMSAPKLRIAVFNSNRFVLNNLMY